ncbi:hypothetical protein HDU91_005191 [Kappamyces sp. JEL0680]|nr:hypothetical protein HDU91_005191 [Kappamyces sp. JEL0680]
MPADYWGNYFVRPTFADVSDYVYLVIAFTHFIVNLYCFYRASDGKTISNPAVVRYIQVITFIGEIMLLGNVGLLFFESPWLSWCVAVLSHFLMLFIVLIQQEFLKKFVLASKYITIQNLSALQLVTACFFGLCMFGLFMKLGSIGERNYDSWVGTYSIVGIATFLCAVGIFEVWNYCFVAVSLVQLVFATRQRQLEEIKSGIRTAFNRDEVLHVTGYRQLLYTALFSSLFDSVGLIFWILVNEVFYYDNLPFSMLLLPSELISWQLNFISWQFFQVKDLRIVENSAALRTRRDCPEDSEV